MARKPRKISERRTSLKLGDVTVPIRIIVETRTNARASITQKALIIRVPHGMRKVEQDREILAMQKWAMKTYEQKPKAFEQFRKQELGKRYTFKIRGERYAIRVDTKASGNHQIISTGEDKLAIVLNSKDARAGTTELIEKLLAKYFAGLYLYEVEERVRELNDAHFGKPINVVKMKDTVSRWGSCSSKGNVNLSSRLLLAPPEILDAVIIHELAHLVEANHSPRFWAEVERALPNYREYDEWLREHGRSLSFQPELVV